MIRSPEYVTDAQKKNEKYKELNEYMAMRTLQNYLEKYVIRTTVSVSACYKKSFRYDTARSMNGKTTATVNEIDQHH